MYTQLLIFQMLLNIITQTLGINMHAQLPIHQAIEYNDYDKTLELINKASKDDINTTNKLGQTPLHLAIAAECFDQQSCCKKSYVVHDLVKKGANVDAQDKNGKTPIHYVTRALFNNDSSYSYENDDLLMEALVKDANINIEDNKGNTALDYISQSKGKSSSVQKVKRILLQKNIKTKTTIDANAPILMQWIVSSPERLNKEAEPGRHPLPNTETFPYRQRLVNMAKVEPDRLICLYYLGDTLNEEQNKQMQDLENLAPNIRAIDFNKLDWSEYDFEFNTSMLSVEDKGQEMKMTEYLKLPNTDNRMGFRLDMMRLMMLLKCPKAVLSELNKIGTWDKSIGEGGIYFDFDFVLSDKMGELQSPYTMSAGYSKNESNTFNYFNSFMAVTTDNNPILIDAYYNLKAFLDLNQPGIYEEFFSDIDKYYSYDGDFLKHRKTASVLAGIILSIEGFNAVDYSTIYFFLVNYRSYRQDINSIMQKNTKDRRKKSVIDIQKRHLKLALDEYQSLLAYYFIGNSFGKFIFDKTPTGIKTKVDNETNTHAKYKLIHKLVATRNNILFSTLPGHSFNITNVATKNEKCRSWAISENLDANQVLGGKATYTKIFDMMYKAPELEIENSVSTNLKGVK